MKDLTKEMNYTDSDTTTLSEIKALANKLLSLTWTINIYRHKEAQTFNLSDLGWTFEFNSRKRAAGLCRPRAKVIYVSRWLLEQNLNKAMNFENTVRHELAHAIDFEMRGTSDHSSIWKAVAREVLCNAERCYTSEEISVNILTKYTLLCDSCGTKKPSHKIKRSLTACGPCCNEHNNGRYSDKYVLRQIKNY